MNSEIIQILRKPKLVINEGLVNCSNESARRCET